MAKLPPRHYLKFPQKSFKFVTGGLNTKASQNKNVGADLCVDPNKGGYGDPPLQMSGVGAPMFIGARSAWGGFGFNILLCRSGYEG